MNQGNSSSGGSTVSLSHIDYTVNKRQLFSNLSLLIAPGEVHSIIGPSGSGKSTIVHLINGLLFPDSGTVTIDGIPITANNATAMRRLIGYSLQGTLLFPHMSVGKNITLPGMLRKDRATLLKQRLGQLLGLFGLPAAYASRYPHELSGGEQQRVALARAFVTSPKILFADEPTGNLDGENAVQVEDLLFGLNKEEKTTLILVTHNLELAYKTETILRMKSGRLVEA